MSHTKKSFNIFIIQSCWWIAGCGDRVDSERESSDLAAAAVTSLVIHSTAVVPIISYLQLETKIFDLSAQSILFKIIFDLIPCEMEFNIIVVIM